jgi:hypothetical protein
MNADYSLAGAMSRPTAGTQYIFLDFGGDNLGSPLGGTVDTLVHEFKGAN